MSKIADVDILVERRPGKLATAIKEKLNNGWDWDGQVLLSSTDGFIAVFTQDEPEVKPTPQRTPRGTNLKKLEAEAKAKAKAEEEAA